MELAPRPPRRPSRCACLLGSALLLASGARAQGGAGARTAREPTPVTLAEVRAVFERVDADRDGALDVREADHGGVEAELARRYDEDGDERLSIEEFVVARQQLLAREKRPLAADLEAESTRIQALWRARKSRRERQAQASGPSARVHAVDRAGAPPSAPSKGAGTSPPAPVPLRGQPVASAPRSTPGLGLSRLQRAAGSGESTATAELSSEDPQAEPSATPAASLEARARAAQVLLEKRLRRRAARPTGIAPPIGAPAPGSRVAPPTGAPERTPPRPSTGPPPAPKDPRTRPEAARPAPPPATGKTPGKRTPGAEKGGERPGGGGASEAPGGGGSSATTG